MVINVYRNIPTEDKIKMYLRFCDYLTKEQMQDGREENSSTENTDAGTDDKE